MNIGLKPTIGEKNISIEVNIFNFDQNIYNQKISISVLEFIRSEMDPALFATKAPRNSPIIVITIVDVVNNNNVLGILSIIISRTLEDPDSEVKK